MAFVFYFVVTPISLIMKIFKKDILNLKSNNDQSYWIKRPEQKSKMKNQF